MKELIEDIKNVSVENNCFTYMGETYDLSDFTSHNFPFDTYQSKKHVEFVHDDMHLIAYYVSDTKIGLLKVLRFV